ncbi:hypothetical protein NKR23_g8364 [Pleurostoma richardsiae]|uniref:Sister chromatid cohesion protein Ctf8 n=1 Tax=Pleurostoma richardsiae TaxID=41990 RepID=A0AA38RIJ9_9PEZI|nr:hypothetical protein NKR23_g8364 [Pleurostoma richardsiae]
MAATSITLHPKRTTTLSIQAANPLPPLLQTPAGLALLELQGTINLPSTDDGEGNGGSQAAPVVPVGRLDFPEYRPDALDPNSKAWMKRVYMYVGQHQRLTGEVKALPRPVAVVRQRRRQRDGSDAEGEEAMGGVEAAGGDGGEEQGAEGRPAEELEVVEIVKYKIVFSQRPEPVGTGTTS